MIRVDYITVGEILLHTKNVILQSKESTTKLHVYQVYIHVAAALRMFIARNYSLYVYLYMI